MAFTIGLRALFSLLIFALPAGALAQAPDYAAIAAGCAPTLKEETIPRDERRQQILAGIHETRFSYTLAQVPYESDLIAECYTDGRMTHRYLLGSAMHFGNPEYGKGALSLSWNQEKHELTLINDNGFALWNRRVTVSYETLDSPWAVVGAEHPKAELRETIDDIGVKELTVYPVIGVLGKAASDKLSKAHFALGTTADFLAQAEKMNIKQCVVIYFFATHGGQPPFPFSDIAESSLPIN